jgi:hypothetical protein
VFFSHTEAAEKLPAYIHGQVSRFVHASACTMCCNSYGRLSVPVLAAHGFVEALSASGAV